MKNKLFNLNLIIMNTIGFSVEINKNTKSIKEKIKEETTQYRKEKKIADENLRKAVKELKEFSQKLKDRLNKEVGDDWWKLKKDKTSSGFGGLKVLLEVGTKQIRVIVPTKLVKKNEIVSYYEIEDDIRIEYNYGLGWDMVESTEQIHKLCKSTYELKMK